MQTTVELHLSGTNGSLTKSMSPTIVFNCRNAALVMLLEVAVEELGCSLEKEQVYC